MLSMKHTVRIGTDILVLPFSFWTTFAGV